MNDVAPDASSGTTACRALPPSTRSTRTPSGWSPTSLAVITSPSASRSLESTSSTVLRPGRAPYSSSFAFGGSCFSRSTTVLSTSSGFASSASSSEPSVCSGSSMSQSSTFSYSSSAIHSVPAVRSLSTTLSRFTRYSSRVSGSRPSSTSSTSRSVPSQSRTICPEPDQAPYRQPPSCTGEAGEPEAWRCVGVPPPSGCSTRADGVAYATESVGPPGSWRRASWASGTSTTSPPGSRSSPALRFSTTRSSPTVVSRTSSPSETIPSSSVVGSAPGSTVHRTSRPGTTAYVVPDSETTTCAAPSSSAVGLVVFVSRAGSCSVLVTHSEPDSSSTTAT